MKNESKSFWVLSVLGVIWGYASFLIDKNMQSSAIPFALGIFSIFIFAQILKRILKINEKIKWFMTNGGWVYIFLWFVTWIIFYNL